jgi:hypothetical protein
MLNSGGIELISSLIFSEISLKRLRMTTNFITYRYTNRGYYCDFKTNIMITECDIPSDMAVMID